MRYYVYLTTITIASAQLPNGIDFDSLLGGVYTELTSLYGNGPSFTPNGFPSAGALTSDLSYTGGVATTTANGAQRTRTTAAGAAASAPKSTAGDAAVGNDPSRGTTSTVRGAVTSRARSSASTLASSTRAKTSTTSTAITSRSSFRLTSYSSVVTRTTAFIPSNRTSPEGGNTNVGGDVNAGVKHQVGVALPLAAGFLPLII